MQNFVKKILSAESATLQQKNKNKKPRNVSNL